MDTTQPRKISVRAVGATLPTLTALRFVAALIVFFSHARYLGLFGDDEVASGFEWLFRQGPISVGFFFVLSGFILAWSARDDDTPPRFWRRRFFKIYPNHILTFLATLVIFATVAQPAVSDDYALANLFLVQSWFPSMEVFSSINPITWTLSCEVLFYFTFPWWKRLIDRIAPARLWLWAGAMVAAVFLIAAVALALPAEPAVPWSQTYSLNQYWLVYVFPPVRIFDFVLGIVLARIVQTGRRLPIGFGGAALLTAVSYVVSTELQGTFSLVALNIVPIGLLVAAGARADIEGRPTFLRWRPIVFAGELSYAFYLWHYLVLFHGLLWLDQRTDLETLPAVGLLLLLLTATVLLAWPTYVLFERPIMRRFAVSRRHRAAVTQPAVAGRDSAAADN